LYHWNQTASARIATIGTQFLDACMITYRKTEGDNSQFGKWTNWFAILRPTVSSCSICFVLSKFVNLQTQ